MLEFKWKYFVGTGLKVKYECGYTTDITCQGFDEEIFLFEWEFDGCLNLMPARAVYDYDKVTPLLRDPRSLSDEEYLELFYESCYITENVDVYNGRDSKNCFILRHDKNESINFCIRKNNKLYTLAQFCYGNGSLFSNIAHVNAFRFMEGLNRAKTIYNYEELLKANLILDAGDVYENK